METEIAKIEKTELIPMRDGWKFRDNTDGLFTRLVVSFPNGYEASIVRSPSSYGGDKGLFEGTVMHSDHGIVYDTPVTNDVEGWMTREMAIAFCDKIAALPVRK